MKVLISCSSSGGHINPSIAFGNYLKEKGIEVTYLGFKNQIEEKLLKEENLILLDCQNSFKKNLKFKNFIKLIKEIYKLRKTILTYDAYIGFGGFINLMLLFLKKNKNLYIHEQNLNLGDSNKIARLFSKKIFYTFPNNDKKGIVVGNPIKTKIKKEFEYKKSLKILFVFGSLGSKSLINKLYEFDGKLNKEHQYYFINGLSNLNKNNKKFQQIKEIEYLNLNENYHQFDLIISRGGATTLYEIIQSKTYCISIPSPYVKNNHQEDNVNYLEDKNLISKLDEKEFTLDKLNSSINQFLDFDFILRRYKDLSNYQLLDSSKLMYDEIRKNVKN